MTGYWSYIDMFYLVFNRRIYTFDFTKPFKMDKWIKERKQAHALLDQEKTMYVFCNIICCNNYT